MFFFVGAKLWKTDDQGMHLSKFESPCWTHVCDHQTYRDNAINMQTIEHFLFI